MTSDTGVDSNLPRRQVFQNSVPPFLALLSVLVATLLIASVYRTYSRTNDEGAHISAGMEWLTHGTYTIELLHPPLARVATAFFPYLAGSRSYGNHDFILEASALLNHDGKRTLTLARLGVLPFFWLTCFLVYRFMSRNFGPWHGALSTVLVAFCPVILAHSSLATTDAPFMAMYLLSVLCLWRFLEQPDAGTATIAGLTFGLACITKFTELPFYLVVLILLTLVYWLRRRHFPVSSLQVVLAVVVVQCTVWAGYLFQVGPMYPSIPTETAWKFQAMRPLERKLLTQVPIPESEFFRGINQARFTGAHPWPSYVLGNLHMGGKWYFFPVGILSKSPVPLLLLFAAGLVLLWRRRREKPYVALVLVIGCFAPLPTAMTGNLNIGLRHVLAMFPFIAMIAAYGVVELWKLRSRFGLYIWPTVAVILVASDVAICVANAPDFLPYFNFTVAPLTDHVLIDSDLDWGQDLGRLETKADQLHIDHLSIAYFGDRGVSMPANWQTLRPNQRPSGWVAVSEYLIRMRPADYGWLDPLPHTTVGHSIRLYHFDAAPQ